MELRHLRYFIAVAEELNFRKASERLRVAQPALSRQIKDLEHELGVRLLDRDTGGARLTEAGAAFLEEARAVVEHAQQAVTVAREAAKGRRGRLAVGYFAPLFMGLIPASLKAFHEKYPDVEVTLVEEPLAEQIQALETGTLQIGFTIGGTLPLSPSLKSVLVARAEIKAFMARGHRLARTRRLTLADMAREPLLCFVAKKGGASVHADIMRRVLTGRGLKAGSIRVIDGAESFRATVESGLGVSLIADFGTFSQNRNLLFRPLADTGPDLFVELFALWPDGQSSPLTNNFIATMRAVSAAKKDLPPAA
jgi:DNA-binding transcriptional LysR family regulator